MARIARKREDAGLCFPVPHLHDDRAMACVLALAALPEEGACTSVWLPARPVLPDYGDIYSKEEMERLLARYRPW